ncbi:hypothetical protein Dd1591_2530 [Dickeya chrysanthemi Ech1591]|uniref:Uncharacterized protein n=1 Tax=Dickeya chrysanthemi (strain Ech1591) TaxID=561229 RepID=C6CL28_DICC1|nr:hypothetical protein Dd1591_2530 [Dickeya chrysanthemi Ech1591]
MLVVEQRRTQALQSKAPLSLVAATQRIPGMLTQIKKPTHLQREVWRV